MQYALSRQLKDYTTTKASGPGDEYDLYEKNAGRQYRRRGRFKPRYVYRPG
ncbi:hypothetical protein HALA3H3_920013 [Halomonas sp. A3H3]|nr:hypothetical protein HALA3H3_920013 [Halomonas sp. A3H3]